MTKLEFTAKSVYTGGSASEIDGKYVTQSVNFIAYDDDGNGVEIKITREQAATVIAGFAGSLK